MTAQTEIRLLPRKQLFLSETEAQRERRSRFNKDALVKLGQSMKATGQLNAIVVRPINGSKFEIVAGERRYIGAGLVGMESLACSVRELTDLQVIEVQLIENLEREDLHPLAEAEAYEALRATMSVKQIAEKVNRDESHVAKTMRLLTLCKPARKAFYDRLISKEIAKILARIPVPKLQEEALEAYLDEAQYSVVSVDEFRGQVEREFMTRLDTAPFDVADTNLVKIAGACGNCPKNTAGQGALFDDVKGKAYCLDTGCYQMKVAAHSAVLLDKAKASGKDVIAGKDAKRIAASGSTANLKGYTALSGHAYGKPVKKLIPKGYEPKLLQMPETGQVIEVVPDSVLQKPAQKADKQMDRYRAEQRAREQARELEVEHRRRVFQAIHAAKFEPADSTHWLRQACTEFFRNLSADTKQLLAKALGWQVKGGSTGMSYARHFDIAPFLPADQLGLWKLLRDLTLAGELGVSTWGSSQPKQLLAAATAAGVDAKKIRAGLVAERKEKTASKAKKKAGRK